ncbi:MAG TPA: C10 family peptidase [Bacteroidales bacterium]|nr:C10 family peptidase [Bacteroidales bacterium]
MKKYLLLSTVLFISSVAFAQYCDISQAEKIALNIITEKFESKDQIQTEFRIKNTHTEVYNNTEVFHVFNLEPQGFVIVSADQSVYPVLAFSDKSEIIQGEINPSALFWLNNYAQQIEYNIKNKIQGNPETENHWLRLSEEPDKFNSKKSVKAVGPMLTTQWNQGRYYNTQCPTDAAGTDGHVAVGCVSTALGQLMNYFRFPSNGTGSYGYEHPEYGWLEVNFAEQNYDYDQMPVSATDYNDNLARLLYNIGVSVDMNYGPDGSGMYNHKGAYTLRTYFDYNLSTTYYFRDSVDAEFQWIDTLIMHLDQKIPLYYAGWSDYEFVSGHAFILDGYSDSTHYHINWGWGGSADGYFYIDDLTPSGSDFTLLHEVIAYAVPASGPEYCNGLKELNTIEGTIEDGSGPLHPYDNNLECTWLIEPYDSVSGIEFEFLKFTMDSDDYLIFYDGENEDAPILQTVYGSDIPQEIISDSDKVLIKFVSDGDSVNDGWLLKYSGIKPEYCSIITTLNADSGIISDGSNSYLYQNNEMCNWNIVPENAENIRVTFIEFDIEPVNDYVKIINSSNQSVATLSGSELTEPIIVPGNKITIMFKTNTSIRHDGFKLFYDINVSDIKDKQTENIKIYPNPVSEKLFIETEFSDNLVKLKILSYDGKTCREIHLNNSSSFEISLNDLSPGLYIAEIQTLNSIQRIKFIKE